MAQPRDSRLNSLLTLIADITQEPSLAYMADMPNPRGVQEAYRKMWRLYSERRTARILTFTKGGAPARNRQCNTLVLDTDVTPTVLPLFCSECKADLRLCLQIDTSDLFFEEEGKTFLLHIYACTQGHEIVVITSDKTIELTSQDLDKAWCVRRWHTIADHVSTNIDILVADRSQCDQCVDTPYLLTEHTLKAYEGTKAGGEGTERYFKVCTNVLYNKALLFKDAKVKKIANQEAGQCECFIVTRATQILTLHHTTLPPLDEISVSEIRVYRCDECTTLNVVIYSQELEVGYSSIILDVKDNFYHILRSDDAMNGIVIAVNKTTPSVTGICRLENFYYHEGKKYDILYTSIIPLEAEHIDFLATLAISHIDTYSAFLRFMKSYDGNPTGEEDELLLEEPSATLLELLGKGYYMGGKDSLLEGCVLFMQDEHKIILHGQLPASVVEPLQLEDLTPLQRAFGLRLNLTIAPLEVTLHLPTETEDEINTQD